MSLLSRRMAGLLDYPEVPPAPPPSLAEQLDAERTAHAHEKEAHDLARSMLREAGAEVLALRDTLKCERDFCDALATKCTALEAQLATVTAERDTMKAVVDALEAQLTAPADPLPKHPRRGG